MKKTFWFVPVLLIAGFFFIHGSADKDQLSVAADIFIYPAGVKKVIDQKCYDCHSVKGKSHDAKDALMWDDLPKLEKSEVVATLDNIIEVLEEGAMPPEEVIEKYPDAKLLPEEKDILHAWAQAIADSLLN
jgi:hypothetical protein